jgi:hypothetical protein
MRVNETPVWRLYTNFNNIDEYKFIINMLQQRGYRREKKKLKKGTVVYCNSTGHVAHARSPVIDNGIVIVWKRAWRNQDKNVESF